MDQFILYLEAQGEGGESPRRQNKLVPALVLDILGCVPARVEGEPGGLEGGHPLSVAVPMAGQWTQ